MKLKDKVISIDVGTTNLKCVLFEHYQMKHQVSYAYQNHQIDHLHYRMDMNEILTEINAIVKQMISEFELDEVDIVLTCAMHSVVQLSDDFNILSPVLTWADKEGSEGLETAPNYYEQSGTPRHIMNPYYKIKGLLAKGIHFEKIGSLKDIIFHALTGEWLIDFACASSSGLMNLHTKQWDATILKDLGITHEQLPRITSGDTYRELNGAFGIANGRVILGYSDGVSSNGAFVSLANAAVLSIGTSHAVRVITQEVILDPQVQNFCYAFADGKYIVGFPSNNGGNVLEWLCKKFNLTFEQLLQIVEKRPSISGVFLPYVYGERAPIWMENASPQFIEGAIDNDFENQLFSMVCGILFNIKVNVEQLKQKFEFDKFALSGGFSASLKLCQLLADILELPLYIPKSKDAETLGTIQLIEDQYRELEYEIIEVNNPTYQNEFEAFKSELVKQGFLS